MADGFGYHLTREVTLCVNCGTQRRRYRDLCGDCYRLENAMPAVPLPVLTPVYVEPAIVSTPRASKAPKPPKPPRVRQTPKQRREHERDMRRAAALGLPRDTPTAEITAAWDAAHPPRTPTRCRYPGCERDAEHVGLCTRDWRRVRKLGAMHLPPEEWPALWAVRVEQNADTFASNAASLCRRRRVVKPPPSERMIREDAAARAVLVAPCTSAAVAEALGCTQSRALKVLRRIGAKCDGRTHRAVWRL